MCSGESLYLTYYFKTNAWLYLSYFNMGESFIIRATFLSHTNALIDMN